MERVGGRITGQESRRGWKELELWGGGVSRKKASPRMKLSITTIQPCELLALSVSNCPSYRTPAGCSPPDLFFTTIQYRHLFPSWLLSPCHSPQNLILCFPALIPERANLTD